MASEISVQEIFGLFLTALLLAVILTPIARRLGLLVGALDAPSTLGVHDEPTVRFGGVAVVVAILVPILIYSGIDLKMIGTSTDVLFGLLLGAMLVLGIGIFVDTKAISPRSRLIGEFLAGVFVVFIGLRLPLAGMWLLGVGFPVLYLVVTANAVNLLDGLNGMAPGLSAIAAVFLGILAVETGNVASLMLACSLAGSCIGFLPHNFPKATVFLGDVGSLSIGFLLGGLVILIQIPVFQPQVFIGSLIVLGLPILDMGFAILRRIRSRRHPFLGDRRHLYDLVSQRGFGPTRAVILMYVLEIAMGAVAVTVTWVELIPALVIAVLVVGSSLLLGINLGALHPAEGTGQS